MLLIFSDPGAFPAVGGCHSVLKEAVSTLIVFLMVYMVHTFVNCDFLFHDIIDKKNWPVCYHSVAGIDRIQEMCHFSSFLYFVP